MALSLSLSVLFLFFSSLSRLSHLSRLSRLGAQWSTPYPSVSHFAGGNSDHGPSKAQTKTQTPAFSQIRRNSDHGPSFWGGKTQTMV